MKKDIQELIKNCDSYQRKKLVRVKTKQPMTITDTPTEAFEKVVLDIVGPLPTTGRGNKYILTIQCNLTKYCEAYALSDSTAPTIAKVFAEEFICRYGSPNSILTDQGTNFMSTTMKQLAKLFKIQQIRTTAFRPQTNGSLERSHLVLIEYLKHYTTYKNDWDKWVRFATFSYNTSVHEATKYTPHELIFGKKAQIPSSFDYSNNENTYETFLVDLTARLAETRKTAAHNLLHAKIKSKKYYDRDTNTQTFTPGQLVYLLVENKKKLGDNYTGPYIVKEVPNETNVIIYKTPGRTQRVHSNRLKHAYVADSE